MEFRRIWVLRGPNVWARFPVVEAELELRDLDAFRPAETAAFADRIRAALAGDEPPPTANLADLLGQLGLELQRRAGSAVRFGQVHRTREPAFYRVVIEYEEEDLARACLEVGRSFCLAAWRGEPFDLPAELKKLSERGRAIRLGPSTAAIVRAARQRRIPTRRLNDGSLVQLGWGNRQHRIWTAETDRTSGIAETIAQDKQLTRALLDNAGVPVPFGRPVTDAADAWRAAEEIGPPVVVKPQFGNQGRGVATDLRGRQQVINAYETARQESAHIVVEKFIPGADHRLLVVGGRLIAAASREPAQVIGNGHSTVAQLVAEANLDPRRSDGHATALSFISLDALARTVLAEQGLSAEAVPADGQKVLIRRNANLSTGGTAVDVTDRVHPEVAARAVEAAQAIGLDVAGVDVVALDIGRPLEEQSGAVVEINAGPGLRMHLEPSAGKPRPVGEAIVASLFPAEQTGRIPIAAITGVNGKTTTSWLIAHLLQETGTFVGLTTTVGMYLNGRRVEHRDCAGPQSARKILLNPQVEAAVLETARGGILREGLGFDHCTVAVVTNIGGGDHLGLRGVETREELARVKRVVVEAVADDGLAVLNATDPLVAAMAAHAPSPVAFFAADESHPVLASHRAAGGRVFFVREGVIVKADGGGEQVVAVLADVPLTGQGRIGFQVENVLAAVAAADRLGVAVSVLRAGLKSFGKKADLPGRFNVLSHAGATIIVDYAQNPSAVAAVTAALDGFPPGHRTLVFSGCNRRDIDLREMGRIAGDAFDRVLLYRDWGHADRADGELNGLLRQGLTTGRRVVETVEFPTEAEALAAALRALQPGDCVVLGVDSIEQSLAQMRSLLGIPKEMTE